MQSMDKDKKELFPPEVGARHLMEMSKLPLCLGADVMVTITNVRKATLEKQAAKGEAPPEQKGMAKD